MALIGVNVQASDIFIIIILIFLQESVIPQTGCWRSITPTHPSVCCEAEELIDQNAQINWLINIWLLCQLAAWRLPWCWSYRASQWPLNATSGYHDLTPAFCSFPPNRSCKMFHIQEPIILHRMRNWASCEAFMTTRDLRKVDRLFSHSPRSLV